jgi:hypothetical protein
MAAALPLVFDAANIWFLRPMATDRIAAFCGVVVQLQNAVIKAKSEPRHARQGITDCARQR